MQAIFQLVVDAVIAGIRNLGIRFDIPGIKLLVVARFESSAEAIVVIVAGGMTAVQRRHADVVFQVRALDAGIKEQTVVQAQ